MTEKLNVSQWGSRWDDPINWNLLNYSISENGRKFIRHPSGMGTVMSMNDGQDRNILVLDAKYRGKGSWGYGTYSRDFYCVQNGYIDELQKPLPFACWSDSILNFSYSDIVNQDIHTSKENTKFMLDVDANLERFAGFCLQAILYHERIQNNSTAPNLNTLIRILIESEKLDSMDPTASLHNEFAFKDSDLEDSVKTYWSSSMGSENRPIRMNIMGFIGSYFPDSEFIFVPVLEI